MYIHNVCICTCRWYTQRKIKQDQWYKRSCEKLNKRKILKRPCGSKFHRQRSYDWSGPPTDRRLHGRECLPICRVSHTSDWVATTQTDAHARFLLTDRPTMKSSTPVLWLDKDHAFISYTTWFPSTAGTKSIMNSVQITRLLVSSRSQIHIGTNAVHTLSAVLQGSDWLIYLHGSADAATISALPHAEPAMPKHYQ